MNNFILLQGNNILFMDFIILCNRIQAFTLHFVPAVDARHMANLFDVYFSVPDPVSFSVHYIYLFLQVFGFIERKKKTEIFKKHDSFLQNLGFPQILRRKWPIFRCLKYSRTVDLNWWVILPPTPLRSDIWQCLEHRGEEEEACYWLLAGRSQSCC